MIKDFDTAYIEAGLARDYPAAQPDVQEMQPIQLAAGPSATVSDAGGGLENADPEALPMEAQNMPGVSVGQFLKGTADTGALMAKGSAQGFFGLGGDIESLIRGAWEFGKSGGDLESFIAGIQEDTFLPTTDDTKKFFDRVAPLGSDKMLSDVYRQNPEDMKITEGLGEFSAPGGYVKAGKQVVKGAKALGKTLGPTVANMAEGALKRQGLMPGVMPDGQTMPANPQAAVSDLGFFSAVEQAALNVQRKSGTGQAFLNDIAKGENVKADEIKWIGLDDFLKGKKNVTRDEVQQFIAQNKVEVQEVTLGGTDNSFTDPNKAIAYIAEREGWTPAEVVDNWGYQDSRDYIALANDMAQQDPVNGALPAKFGQYTLPGGENYREILLTMPDNTDPQKARLAFEQRMQQKYGNFNTMKFTDAEKAESESTMQAILDNDGVVSKGQVFKSSHWDQKNVLAHIRVNDRVDADGKKMLLIEEVQSDWHQAGRDKGYIGNYAKEDVKPYTPEQAKDEFGMDNSDLFWYFKVPGNTLQIPKSRFGTQDEAMDYVMTEKKVNPDGVPDAPMKDTWYQLALKRALKYAADNGYERVGITTGARQAERYDLSKQVDRVIYNPESQSFNVYGKNDDLVHTGRISNPEELEQYVGKDATKKVLQQLKENPNKPARITGLDLQVGGEGMKKYYDEVYPKFLEKYGKKWGAKVGETTIETKKPTIERSGTAAWKVPGKTEPIRFVDITPEMRQSVGKGQPLFTAAPVGAGTAATMQDEENQ